MIKKIIIVLSVLVNYVYAIDATMEIIKNKTKLPTISVVVSSDTTGDVKLANSIVSLINKDLLVSGHFNSSEFVIENSYDRAPNNIILKQNGIDLYLIIKLKINQVNGAMVNIKLYDINSNDLVLSKTYSISSTNRYPFLSHKIAIDVNNYLKAPSIDWMDKFVIFSRYLTPRTSEIVISDYTLTYQKVVVKGGLNIFPKWASSNQESFYYTTYKYDIPTLIKQNLYTGESKRILSSDGMMVCSDVSKDGDKLVLTMAPNSHSDIYVYDVKTRLKTRITNYSGIDVGGSFIENDKKIVFISDRLKYPNIFAKKIGEKGVERLIYHGRNNSQCTTYSDYIVYSSRETDNEFGGNAFNLYLMSTRSDYVRRLTTSGRNQFPKFSTDGESILFIKNDEKSSYLGIIRVNYNKSFIFTLKSGKLQSIDW
ncbi:MAG: Tol-Pal system protein TolB [Campylobacterota bacterium]|nr:Tol-Pal system protein TolB [Campylobacterota bacterium]